jgi:UDP-N-acetylmuramate: L-alanyl-gamma-D-glutamyl-meso-diaminopimelate ligase
VHIHILGIAGTFMGGLAAIARQAGHRVTGCDANVYPPMSDQLRALDIDFVDGFSASQLAFRPDLFVIGNVVRRGNPLMEAVLDARLPYISGPQWLGEQVLAHRPVLAVAGTHGKTTTTALSTFLLRKALGTDVGYLIGGVAHDFASSGWLGDATQPFVIEADEYDTAFFDKRSKFLHYRPTVALLNNLEFDHADIFADLAAIEWQFHQLLRTMSSRSVVVLPGAPGTGEALERVLARGCWSEVERFGSPGQGLWAEGSVSSGGRQRFALMEGSARIGEASLALGGSHNLHNALAALTAVRRLGLAPQHALEALADFGGVRRRLELRGTVNGVSVYDDFAHHPTAIEASVAALCAESGQRVFAVVEPRSNTMKLGTMSARLPWSLRRASRVYCCSGSLDWDVAAALAPLGDKAVVCAEVGQVVEAVVVDVRAGDRVLVMSNGAFGGIHARLLQALALRKAALSPPRGEVQL